MKKIIMSLTFLGLLLFVVSGGDVGAKTIELTEEQKLDYYQEYEKIVNEINSSEPNSTLELVPFGEFVSEDFIEPEDFEKYAIERSNANFNIALDESNVDDGITPFSIASATKSKTVKSNGLNVKISVKGSFNTQYNSVYKRQIFDGIRSISVTPSQGKWTKSTSSGYSAQMLDNGRTYKITVSGVLTINGLMSAHHVTLEFYCNGNGSVG